MASCTEEADDMRLNPAPLLAVSLLSQAALSGWLLPSAAQESDEGAKPAPASASATSATPAKTSTTGTPGPGVPSFNLNSRAIAEKAQAYKVSPDETTWQAFLQTVKNYLSDTRVLKAPAQQILQQNPALRDLQTKIVDAGGARIFIFTGSRNSHSLIVQSAGAAASAPAGETIAAAPPSPGARVSIVDYPESVNLSAAHMVRSLVTTIKRVKVGRRKFVNQKFVHAEGPAYLVVSGIDRGSGLLYLGAYKQYQGAWIATAEPFSQLPQHFLENLSGLASFSGNDIVLAVSSQSSGSNLPKPKSSTYQIVLHLSAGHYQLAGSPSKDMPVSIIAYFLQCFRMNRLDLAKAWLADPGLISIPKYAGLSKMTSESSWKLVTMTQPAGGGYRFRLVTNNSHDLIFDLGAAKHQLLIKGIFIAPPDPLAKSLTGVPVSSSAAAPVVNGATGNHNGGATQAPAGNQPNPGAVQHPAAH